MATSAEILTPFTVLAAFQIIGIRECFHWISQTKRREAVRMGFSRIIKSIFSAMVSPADDPCAIKYLLSALSVVKKISDSAEGLRQL
jgi:hypothetical protein